MRFPPPGRLIDVGTHRLHIHCLGSGTPAVILDAALGGSSLSWTFVHPEVARVTTACAYDRAGFGWSEAGPLPRTARRIVDELDVLVRRAGVPPPYVLVGHSFGGLAMRLFAGLHPERTAGLVLLDPAHPEHWADPAEKERVQIERGVRLCRQAAFAARIGVARIISRLVGVGALRPARALAALMSRGALRREDESVMAPAWKLPPEARRPLKHFWTEEKFFTALGSQIESICESARQVAETADRGFGDRPTIVISAGTADEDRLRLQEALAHQSTRGRHVVAEGSGHWIPLDRPDLVVRCIVEVVEACRA
ncbi:MAG TPA: alpha/beta hydrolase [Vicinamibacterales bacterium]|nr:alpha/beta hydrolase [Vicinamibacterales bacterium]